MQQIELPRFIHFIWAGGNKEMPEPSINKMVKWAKQNPGFIIQLWIDSKTFDKGKEVLEKYYIDSFIAEHKKLYRVDLKESEVRAMLNFKEIRESEICNDREDIVLSELKRLDPNYGCSSDILRYRILCKYGGAYFDSDVEPGPKSLAEIIGFGPQGSHILYLDHVSQLSQPPREKLEQFNISSPQNASSVGNDSFVCTKDNPLMRAILQDTERNYDGKNNHDLSRLKDILELAYYSHELKQVTLSKTGPVVVQNALIQNANQTLKVVDAITLQKKSEHGQTLIRPLVCRDYQLTTHPEGNTRNWLNVEVDIKRIQNTDQMIGSLVQNMSFEAEHFGILRLEDHMKLLEKIAKQMKIDSSKACSQLLLALDDMSINFTKIAVCQWCSPNPSIEKFYKQNGLMDRTFLTTNNKYLGNIYSYAAAYPILTTGICSFEVLCCNRAVLNNPGSVLGNLKPLEIQAIFEMVQNGVSFIELIMANKCSLRFPISNISADGTDLSNVHFQLNIHHRRIMELFAVAFRNNGIDQRAIDDLQSRLNIISSKTISPLLCKYPLHQILNQFKTTKDGNSLPTPDIALRRAAATNKVEIVDYLLFYTSSPNVQDSEKGRAALHWAVENNSIESVDVLIQSRANINIQDNKGQTPLHLAAEKKNYQMISKLIANGANYNIPNIAGTTVEQLAKADPGLLKAIIEGKKLSPQHKK